MSKEGGRVGSIAREDLALVLRQKRRVSGPVESGSWFEERTWMMNPIRRARALTSSSVSSIELEPSALFSKCQRVGPK